MTSSADQSRTVPARTDPVPLRPAATPRGPVVSLPTRLTSFVGREREVAAVTDLLHRDGIRLVTLTGPGGVGKTRLALRVAERAAVAFPDGIWFVPLAPVRDPALLATTIIRTLGVVEQGDRPAAETLATVFQDRRLLVVLDNFEHLLTAAPLLTELLAVCPNLVLLVTSRARLNLSGEHALAVPPLTVARRDGGESRNRDVASDLLASEAVRLFVARASAVAAAFSLTEENTAAVGAICDAVDGLPLAIELAAAQTRLFSPPALLARLERRLPLLTGGPRDAPARLQTMRGAIAWSHDLLSEAERALFRRLGVFVGGFTLEAAEAVVGAGGWGLGAGESNDISLAPSRHPEGTRPLAPDVLNGVAALVDHQLLRRVDQPDGEPRFAMLETIREYALERLEDAGEERRARDAHAAFFVGLEERLEPNHLEPGQRFDHRLRSIEAEHPNLRAALAHLAETGDPEGVLRLAGALAVFWHHGGYLREGRRWLEWALAHTAETPTVARGRALAGLSLVVWTQNDTPEAERLAHVSLAIAERHGDTEFVALSLHMLGLVANVQRRWERARFLSEQALRLWRDLTLPSDEAMALSMLGAVAYGQGDAAACARHAEEALALFRALGYSSGAAMELVQLGRLAGDRGDARGAMLAYQEALRLWADLDERWAIVRALSGLAALAAAHGQAEAAATLIGAIDARLHEAGASIFPADRAYYDRAAEGATVALGAERFAELRAAGQALPLVAAIDVAAAVTVPDVPAGATRPDRGPSRAGTLTQREREVVPLVVRGLSNRQIAAALHIGERTVESHITNILAKWGLTNRAQIAAAAADSPTHALQRL